MPRRTSPALQKLVIDLPGATVTLVVGSTSMVTTESEKAVDHCRRLVGRSRILRWEESSQARGRRGGIIAYGDITGSAIGDNSVVNSGDAVASGPGSFANTGIVNGRSQSGAREDKHVTIAIPATVQEIVIQNAGDLSPSEDFKELRMKIKDNR